MHVLILLTFLCVFSIGCSSAGSLTPNVALFDTLITRGALFQEFGAKTPIKFSKSQTESTVRQYLAEYEFKRRAPTEHYTLNISIAPAGHFLDPVDYERRRDSEAQGGAPPEADYPSIGKRARREFLGAGPGGAAYGLVFTTSDAQFDIRITVSNLIPEGVEEPYFDVDGFARRLSDRYDAAAKSEGH